MEVVQHEAGVAPTTCDDRQIGISTLFSFFLRTSLLPNDLGAVFQEVCDIPAHCRHVCHMNG